MFSWFKPIDTVLRGDLQLAENAERGKIEFPLLRIVVLSVLLASFYGASIGSFATVSNPSERDAWMQLLASVVKASLLFYLTLLVTFPSLYVFNALMGSRLDLPSVLRLLVAAIAVMVAILASLGPIIVFFSFSTPAGNPGYRFILLMVVALSAGAGILGLHYLLRMLNQFSQRISESPNVGDSQSSAMSSGHDSSKQASANFPGQHLTGTRSPAKAIFRVWVLVFAVVGAQMSWVLRPFVGSPDQEFTWFRVRTGNFFQTVYYLIRDTLTCQ